MAFVLFLMTVVVAMAQRQVITGKITDPSGQAMPGVNILLKGTSMGAATDVDGAYSIEASPDNILVISFIGYKGQEITVGSQTKINVTLETDLKTLEEVVVVGYGEMRKTDIAAAQTSISSKDLNRTVNTSLEQAIQGRAAGVYVTQNTGAPGGGISVNIRGINSINGANEPLYVIDGVQIQGSISPGGANALSFLNPADIENMQILQGPNATAIYGSRGTNGVILITTKRGKSGDVKISYDYGYSLQTTPKQLSIMNLQQYAQMDLDYKAIAGGNPREEFLDPSILGAGTNWQKELFRNAAMQKHQVSVSGGNEASRYYFSGERLNQEGIAPGSGYDRSSVRLNLDTKARKWLTLGTSLSYSQQDNRLSTTQSNIIVNAIQMAPNVAVRNMDGTFGGGNISNSAAEQFLPPNPIGLAQLTMNDLTQRKFLGSVNVDMTLLPGLSFRIGGNTNFDFQNSTYFLPTYKFGYQENTQAVLTNRSNFTSAWQLNQTLQYAKQFGKHHLDVMFTHEAQASQYKNLMAERKGFSTNDVVDIQAGDANLDNTGGGHGVWAMESYLGRLNYNFSDRYILTAAFRADGSINFGSNNRWGYFPSIAAAWNVSQEPFFNVPFINDLRLRYETGLTGAQGSSGAIYGTLTAGPSAWGTSFIPNKYPNQDFKWEQTKTNNFGINIGLLDNRLQIEGDYYIKNTDNLILQSSLPWYMGTTGSLSVGAPFVNVGSLENKGWGITIRTTNINNGKFKWESDLNLSHFKTRVKSLTTGQAQIDKINWWMSNWTQRTVVGQSPWMFYGYIEDGIFQNRADLENSALPADNNGVEYPIAENSIWVGDVKYRDVNNDGIINGNDQTFIGNPWPKLFAGFNNSFSYKGITLNVFITSSYGNDIYNYIRKENSNPNNINLGRNMFTTAFDYAKVATNNEGDPYLLNPGTNVARMSGGNKNNNYDRHTTKFVEDGSYIRVKNISLSYNLPGSLISALKYVKNVRLGGSVQNAFTITGYSGYDPEVGAYVGPNAEPANAAIGVDYGRYPLTPVYSLNVGIDF
jgi:TonB-linked SusC/RagA family outer membrane protein